MTNEGNQLGIPTLRNLTDEFRQHAQSCSERNGRKVVAAEAVINYVNQYLRTAVLLDRSKCPEINLAGLEVNNTIVFPQGDYPAISFRSTQFDGDTKFESIVFHGNVDFYEVCSESPAKHVSFQNVTFGGEVKFTRASLPLSTFGKEVHFKHNVGFENATIGEVTHVTFDGDAIFSGTKFKSIDNAVFHSTANFDYSEKSLLITNASFEASAVFRGISCYQAQFVNVIFKKSATFEGTEFKGKCQFTQTIFYGRANFNDCKFRASTYFQKTIFWQTPSFYDAEMYPDVSFLTSDFRDFKTVADANAYREIRKHAPAEDGRFFVYEQRAMANTLLRSDFIAALLSKAYDVASEYGQSVMRPLLFMVGTNVIAWLLFAHTTLSGHIHALDGKKIWAKEIDPAVGLTVQNILNPFGLWGKETPFVPDSVYVVGVSVIQSLFTIIFLTLFLLAVRRRLRKGSE